MCSADISHTQRKGKMNISERKERIIGKKGVTSSVRVECSECRKFIKNGKAEEKDKK